GSPTTDYGRKDNQPARIRVEVRTSPRPQRSRRTSRWNRRSCWVLRSPSRKEIRLAILPCRQDRPVRSKPLARATVAKASEKMRIPTGHKVGTSPRCDRERRSPSRSVWGGQLGRSQETTLLPKTSA